MNPTDLLEPCYDDRMKKWMPYGFWPRTSTMQESVQDEVDDLCKYFNKKYPNNIFGFKKSFINYQNKKYAVLPETITLNNRERKFKRTEYHNLYELQEDWDDFLKDYPNAKFAVYSISVWTRSQAQKAGITNNLRINWEVVHAWG